MTVLLGAVVESYDEAVSQQLAGISSVAIVGGLLSRTSHLDRSCRD